MHRVNSTWMIPLTIVLLCAPAVSQTTEIDNSKILAAFAKTSAGYSSDELLIQDGLRDAFLAEFGKEVPAEAERDILLRLLRLRKAGKLLPKATRRGETIDAQCSPIAEIAARVVVDRHRVTSDTMLADPRLRSELQAEAEKISPKVDPYAIRKSVLQLRKKRALKPELVLQVAQWDREVKTYALEELRSELERGGVATDPGVYLFRNSEGYLYIGEADSLAKRLKQHLLGSDRQSLAEYLASDDAENVSVEMHIFPAKSPAKKVTVRRAYESELIRSRNPKFNVRP